MQITITKSNHNHEIEDFLSQTKDMEGFIPDMARQLIEVMRENERLRDELHSAKTRLTALT